MARGYREFYRQYMGALPAGLRDVKSIYGDIAQKTGYNYQNALRQYSRGHTGSPYGGAYQSGKLQLGGKMASDLANIRGQLKMSDRAFRKDLLNMAIQHSEAEKTREARQKAQGLAGLGKLGGTALGAGISLIPGAQPIGLGIMGASAGMGGNMGGNMGGDIDQMLQYYMQKYPFLFEGQTSEA